MQNLEWYLADLKSTGKNTIETVEKSLTDMFISLVRIYPCLCGLQVTPPHNSWSEYKHHASTLPVCNNEHVPGEYIMYLIHTSHLYPTCL